MEDKQFSGEVWSNLLRLTAENLTPDKFSAIMLDMLHRPDVDIHKLSYDQAQRLTRILSPIPKLKKLLWEKATVYVGPEQADLIAAAQVDELAVMLVRDADMSLFPKD